jgi:hypothetical protein
MGKFSRAQLAKHLYITSTVRNMLFLSLTCEMAWFR